MSVDELAALILNSGAREALILLDVCRAGFAAAEVQAALDRQAWAVAGAPMRLAVLVSCLHHERSYSGLFVEAVVGALEEGSGAEGEQRHWRDLDPWITPGELCDELCDRLGEDQVARVAGLASLKIIPNPRYRAGAADRSVALGQLLKDLDPDDREHFLIKASGADALDLGWFFTGREGVTRQILSWLADSAGGILILTGSPGAGKSAVLGRLAVLSDRRAQGACRALGMLDTDPEFLPPVGLFDAVLHLKNKTVDTAALDLADQLGIDVSNSDDPATALVMSLGDSGRSVTVMADALDEAVRGEETLIARDLLRAAADLAECRVVVGTRRDRDGRIRPGSGGSGPLISLLMPRRSHALVVDLDRDTHTRAAIESYVAKRLKDEWDDSEAIAAAARAVAARSTGIFLYARFAVRALIGSGARTAAGPPWDVRFNHNVGTAGLYDVLAADLNRFDDPELVHEVLQPLAFARGKGLPRRQVWPTLATALASSGRAYTDADISRVIREAGWYLIEATEDGQAVFRLYHQSISDYLRSNCTLGGGNADTN
ncbi:hypothetical protein ACWD8I_13980 [Micromonospora arida]|uniref:hypothetical protein n=1 Tax=Micromonospora arida TaxID=2203715 RepID=UPI0033ECF304